LTFFVSETTHIWQCISIALFIVGIILLVVDIKAYRTRKRKLSLPESVDKSKAVWGLWHTGARFSEEHLVEHGTSIKRILLFDYCNTNKLINMVNKGEASGHENDVIAQIRRLTEQALALKDEGVEVRWYSDPIDYSIAIFERENENIKTIDDFSNSAWLHGEFFLAKVKRHKRPKFLIELKGKQDEQKAFKYYAEEYQRIWDKARLINSLEDMECGNL